MYVVWDLRPIAYIPIHLPHTPNELAVVAVMGETWFTHTTSPPVDGLYVHAPLDSRGTAVAVRILRLNAYCPVATLALLLDVTALYTSIECQVFLVFDLEDSEIVIVIVHVSYFSCVMLES